MCRKLTLPYQPRNAQAVHATMAPKTMTAKISVAAHPQRDERMSKYRIGLPMC